MTRWSRIRPVAAFELECAVRSKSWLITTFGMPVFLLLYAALVSIPVYLTSQKENEVAVYGVVDEARILNLEGDLEQSAIEIPKELRSALEAAGQRDVLSRGFSWFQNFVFRPFASNEDASAALIQGGIKAYFHVPSDYVESGRIEEYSPDASNLGGSDARRALGKLLVTRLVAGKVSEEISARVLLPIRETQSWVVTRSGEVKSSAGAGKAFRVIVPVAFTILLLISIFMSAGALIQATGIEKENKVVEVLLSSARPDEILMGKLLGLGVAGALQITVWFVMVGIAAVGFTAVLAGLGVTPPWGGMLAAVLFFPLAYLFFGSLMLGTGSLGTNQREANQWGMIWTFLAAIPMMFVEMILREPHGTIARTLTWLPFSAPTTVIMRLTVEPDGIRWWEILGSIAVLLVSIWFTIRLSARLFRVGMLLTGARPKLREILRQARLS